MSEITSFYSNGKSDCSVNAILILCSHSLKIEKESVYRTALDDVSSSDSECVCARYGDLNCAEGGSVKNWLQNQNTAHTHGHTTDPARFIELCIQIFPSKK